MNPDEINTLIATACGWTNVHPLNKWKEGGPKGRTDGTMIGNIGNRKNVALPNYHGSLDAMHEAEKTLDDMEWYRYVNHLRQKLELGGTRPGASVGALSSEKAEAFVYAKGLDE